MNNQRDETATPPSTRAHLAIPSRVSAFLAGPWPVAILLLLALLPYLGILRNDFTYVYDDKLLILDNPYVHSLHHLREVLTSILFSNMGVQSRLPYYRPMADLSYWLGYKVFGPHPFGFHLVSLAANTIIVMLVYAVAGRILPDRMAAFCAAALYAIHPVHVEVLAWATALIDIDVALFYLLTFWCFLKLEEGEGGPGIAAFAGMIAGFVLALFSKEQAVTLPLLATIYEYGYRSDRRGTSHLQKMLRYGPLWLLAAGYLLIRVKVLGGFAHNAGANSLNAGQVIFSALALVGQYAGLLLWPVHLSEFHPFHASTSLFALPVLAGAGVLALSAVLFCALWKRTRPASFGILWFFILLFPVLNARWMSDYVLGERHLYLSSVGFCLVAGWACSSFWRSSISWRGWVQTAAVAAVCVVAALCVLRISLRVLDWRNDVTLFSQAVAAEPGDYRMHDELGDALWLHGDANGAGREWREELRLQPTSVSALSSLGMLYAQQKQFDRAFPLLQKAAELDPGDAHLHLNLGAAYAETGRLDLAEKQFRAAAALDPMSIRAHNVLGKLYFDSQRWDEAEQQFRKSLQCEPNLAAYDHLGYIYAQRGDAARAEAAFKAALAMNGADRHAHFNLGKIYAATGRTPQAVEELKAALAADPHNPEITSLLEKLRQ